jgi:biotin transport system substrate-specific component
MIGGIIVLYAFGIAYLAVAAQIGLKQAFVGSLAFIPGDLMKAFVAALVGRAVMAGYPLLPARS